jgi:uncharacterized membrane protein YgaE (UPF0421/DUF939 family)
MQVLEQIRNDVNEFFQWTQFQEQIFDQLQQDVLIFTAEMIHFLTQFEE